ncbi:hypothetical protein PILCRDRAFT_1015 [Piloderma croceum F 1598]|uniref:NAD-dependent epimerase/dehydratase domain-containing protein n=1 Tax=Piloderma croceum (strain F 1598) TaxID=765440 RepID=A0A0C3BW29_PILCF|nr:hypothetical protein PILCRDRAFT_1015 [Piloderma croceum F 1598]
MRATKRAYRQVLVGKFAVIGAGVLGLPIVKALLERDVSVLIITRPDSSTPVSSFPAAAKSLAVDLSDVTALASVFHEHAIEVVVSTIAHAGLPTQYLQADAAKAAGVKLFYRSCSYYLAAFRACQLIAAMYGDKVEVVHVDEFPHDEFRTFLHDIHDKGMASTGYDFAAGKELSEGAGSSNKLWAGHRWEGIKEILNI